MHKYFNMVDLQTELLPIISDYKNGKVERSHRLAANLLRKFPSSVELLNLCGVIKRDLKMFSEALEHFKKIIQLKPNYIAAYVNMGTLLVEVGQFEDALKCFLIAMKIDRDDPDVHYNLGNLNLQQGKTNDAIASYKSALKSNVNYKEAYNNLGQIYLSTGKVQQARSAYQKAFEIDPDYFHSNLNLGNVCKAQRKYQEALHWYKAAAKISPKAPGVYNNLGSIYALTGDIDQAILSYKAALKLNPHFSGCIENLLDLVVQLPGSRLSDDDFLLKLKNENIFNKLCTPRAAILNAIRYLVECDLKAAASWLNHFSNLPISQIHALDLKTAKFCGAFNTFVSALLKHCPRPSATAERFVYHVGESHCLSYAHRDILVDGVLHKIQPMIVLGAKAFHFSEPGPSKYKKLFEINVNSIPAKSYVFLSFGEIDCRLDEGIISAAVKTGKTLDAITADTVNGFIQFCMKVNQIKRHKLFYLNLPAPVYNHSVSLEKNIKRARVTKLFNDMLAEIVSKNALNLIDVYCHTSNGDGFSNLTHHLDMNHLGSSIIPLIQPNLE